MSALFASTNFAAARGVGQLHGVVRGVLGRGEVQVPAGPAEGEDREVGVGGVPGRLEHAAAQHVAFSRGGDHPLEPRRHAEELEEHRLVELLDREDVRALPLRHECEERGVGVGRREAPKFAGGQAKKRNPRFCAILGEFWTFCAVGRADGEP